MRKPLLTVEGQNNNQGIPGISTMRLADGQLAFTATLTSDGNGPSSSTHHHISSIFSSHISVLTFLYSLGRCLICGSTIRRTDEARFPSLRAFIFSEYVSAISQLKPNFSSV